DVVVDHTLPHLLAVVQAMVEAQRLTGMRPGEVVRLRAFDLDMAGKVWLYRPGSDRGPMGQHKTTHHGYQRIVAIGPKAQAVIRPWLKLDTQAYLFSPCEAMETQRAERRQKRKTKIQPSQAKRKRKRKPQRSPTER